MGNSLDPPPKSKPTFMEKVYNELHRRAYPDYQDKIPSSAAFGSEMMPAFSLEEIYRGTGLVPEEPRLTPSEWATADGDEGIDPALAYTIGSPGANQGTGPVMATDPPLAAIAEATAPQLPRRRPPGAPVDTSTVYPPGFDPDAIMAKSQDYPGRKPTPPAGTGASLGSNNLVRAAMMMQSWGAPRPAQQGQHWQQVTGRDAPGGIPSNVDTSLMWSAPQQQYAAANMGAYSDPSKFDIPAGTVLGTSGYLFSKNDDGSYTRVGSVERGGPSMQGGAGLGGGAYQSPFSNKEDSAYNESDAILARHMAANAGKWI